jgi:ABC-2 type transport system permease protein
MKIYIAFILASIQAKIEYKIAFFFYILAILFFYISQIGLLFILLGKFHTIKGWSAGEISFLYGLLTTSQGFSAIFFTAFNDFEQMIIKGNFDRLLVRPLNIMGQIICDKFDVSAIASFIIGPLALYYGSSSLNIDWQPGKIIFFPVVLLGAVLIQGGIRILVASITFWTLKNESLVHTIVYSSKEFVVYPISIYNKGVQLFLTFMFPLGFINYYPAHFFLDKSSENLFYPALQFGTPVVGAIVFISSLWLWRSGINNYQSSGS